jgi:lysophospholipase L1-like esterase
MIKRIAVALLLVVVGLAAMIGVEIVLALRREYLPTEPVLNVEGTFGPTDATPLRFVVLGDSTAAGIGAGDADAAYPTLLARRLASEERRVHMTSFGVSGARVEDVLEEQLALAIAAEPDLVFVGIGANDVTHLTPLDDITADMRAIIRRLLDQTDATVVVAGAPDMRADAWYEPLRSLAGWRGRQVAEAVAAAAEAEGVPVVPLAKLTRPFFESSPELAYSDDEFHPGPGGYAKWAEVIYPYLEAALRDRTPNKSG